ncbi:DUF2164 domain-containing protein [Rhizobium sp. ARZ01]|uniref:DUF2164 domain-containing protein n=1 Tax=Rhizobium sp. ARZ01 TaxID=2769313 RepID=UPI0017857808|nr:DUF2164 domain-containing protein [Rhizobium sp. ARZ01]MBD9372885.1 DUF2164 domain-containing protein [Rhizobium sp. ARZ01]
MKKLELPKQEKADIVRAIQVYFTEELEQDIGTLPAELLLDFLSGQIGPHHYNRGLRDAHTALLGKMEELADALYRLEEQRDIRR